MRTDPWVGGTDICCAHRVATHSTSVCPRDDRVEELTGDSAPDQAALARADILITTPEKWDGVSRGWQKRDYVKVCKALASIMSRCVLVRSARLCLLGV